MYLHALPLQLILTHFEQRRAVLNCTSAASISWVLGKKHIFLSESARQQLELVRNDCRVSAAILLQSTWRGYNTRRKWPLIKQNLLYCRSKYAAASRSPFTLDPKLRPPRPQPITGTPPPSGPPQVLSAAFSTNSKPIDMCDFNMVRETCALLGFDLVCYSLDHHLVTVLKQSFPTEHPATIAVHSDVRCPW